MRYSAFYLLSLLAVSTQYWLTLGQATSNPKNEDFLRRSLCSATVNGNYVYIDGGEISWMRNGENALSEHHPSQSGLSSQKGGAYAQSKNMAYYFGGFASPKTDGSIAGFERERVALPGLVSYNMSSLKVANTSSDGFGDYNTFRDGSMEAIPFGPEGLLLVLGGSQAPPLANTDEDWNLMDFRHVFIYDLKARKWHKQQTTGDQPTPRDKFCTVGVDGPNNTFDIFMYGGRMGKDGISDEVHVLTLPGFRFFKAKSPGSTTARLNHACDLIGNRHMLSIGGSSDYEPPASWNNRDPWTRGLGVFDLTQMTWSNKYNDTAAKYDSSAVVRRWYDSGGMDEITWNKDVESLFALKPTSDPTSNASPDEVAKRNVGTIVGAVVGGVVGLALIIGIVLFFLRRKKRKAAEAEHVSDETTANPPAYEKRGPEIQQAPGLDDIALRTSAAPDVHEMSGNLTPVELPGDHGTSEGNHSNSRNEVAG
ncbi:unnamed protein product [Colletotrichum noveboracense]|uniref:Kelch repeat protein n=1 Tax=Colletotrichum noveboracense TaxID=2664923 RepID=A0A9W4WI65_9PEZI|nr:unnamed protein product [Colletotrichum noveboracense]